MRFKAEAVKYANRYFAANGIVLGIFEVRKKGGA